MTAEAAGTERSAVRHAWLSAALALWAAVGVSLRARDFRIFVLDQLGRPGGLAPGDWFEVVFASLVPFAGVALIFVAVALGVSAAHLRQPSRWVYVAAMALLPPLALAYVHDRFGRALGIPRGPAAVLVPATFALAVTLALGVALWRAGFRRRAE